MTEFRVVKKRKRSDGPLGGGCILSATKENKKKEQCAASAVVAAKGSPFARIDF